MKTLFSVFLLSILCSCASSNKDYTFKRLKFESFTYHDVENKAVYISRKPLDLQQRYFQYEKSGQINRDLSKSCFTTGEVVNFVDVLLHDVPHFRPYVSKQKYEVTYKSVDTTDAEGRYESLHVEKRKDHMTVEQQSCWKIIDGLKHFVISERYAYRQEY